MDHLNEMINKFTTEFPFIKTEDIQIVLPDVQFNQLEKGDQLVKFDQQQDRVAYIIQGLVKSYFYDEDGNERVFKFESEGQVTGNWFATLLGQPSEIFIEALEPTIIVETKQIYIEKWVSQSFSIARIYNHYLKIILADSLKLLHKSFSVKPDKRYTEFMEDYPDLVHRIPQKDMASYLGITPSSWSRLKKKMKSKK